MSQYCYDPGDKRTKHKWKANEAGFQEHPDTGQPIGKCDCSISQSEAEDLLRSGIFEPNATTGYESIPIPHPDRIFNYHKGAVYVAVPTVRGKSYHGYPYRGKLNPSVKSALAERAKNAGQEKEFRKWIRNHCS